MANSCFNDAEPINPINQLLVDVFGENFFPPYSASGQPVKHQDLGNEKLLQMDMPGGTQIKPPGIPQLNNIADLISPITTMIGTFFTFLGPLFIIIDVIRGIIDVICALLNPIPLIAAIIQLLVLILPPLIALFPPFAMILMAINVCKLVTAIIVSMLSILIPIIDLIVKNALSIIVLLAPPNFNLAAIDGVNLKICTLLQHFENQIGAFGPISIILELLDLFMSLGAAFFCVPSLSGGAATEGAPGSPCCDNTSCPPFIVNPPVGRGRVISKFDATIFEAILPKELLEFLGISSTMSIEIETATSSANEFGLVSSKGIGGSYSFNELLAGAKYVVSPSKIPQPADAGPADGPASPHTLALKMVRRSDGLTKTARIKELKPSINNPNKMMAVVDRVDFEVNNSINYSIVPNTSTLFSLSMIGLGCINEVANATKGLVTQVNADAGNGQGSGAGAGTGGATPNITGFSSLTDKLGETFPRPPNQDLALALAKISQDPTTDITNEVKDILLNYADQVTQFYDKILCVGASKLHSSFSIDKSTIISDGYDSATISLTIKDQGGNPILHGLLPTSTATAEFYTTQGDIGPIVFDETTGTYRASFTSSVEGSAEISVAFIINDNTCMVPGIFDGFITSEKILRVNMIPRESTFARRRPTNQYVQSGRGKRR